jgi:hypothetical protein
MGRGSTFYCRTCKVEIYLGYGSSTTWLDGCCTSEEYRQRVAVDPNLDELAKNQNVHKALQAHQGHDIGTYSEDWTYTRDGKVYGQFSLDEKSDPILVDRDDTWTRENWSPS